jgi:hypothetical protein
MITLNVRQLVEEQLSSQWPEFAAAHPRLAVILDDDLLLESAVASLVDDPEYQRAMANANATALAAETIAGVVGKVVGRFLKSLV